MADYPTDQGAVCKGDINFGSHCGDCPRCKHYGWKLGMKPEWLLTKEKSEEEAAKAAAEELRMKYIAIITASTSLGEARVYSLADELLFVAGLK